MCAIGGCELKWYTLREFLSNKRLIADFFCGFINSFRQIGCKRRLECLLLDADACKSFEKAWREGIVTICCDL